MNVPRMTRQARFSRLRDLSAARPKPPNDYEGSSPNAGLGYTGRRMPSLRMRAWSVVRFMPSRVAAPLGPALRHCVCLSARQICWRSASSRVEIEEVKVEEGAEEVKGAEASAPGATGEPEACLSSERGMNSSWPGDRNTA